MSQDAVDRLIAALPAVDTIVGPVRLLPHRDPDGRGYLVPVLGSDGKPNGTHRTIPMEDGDAILERVYGGGWRERQFGPQPSIDCAPCCPG